MQDYSDVLGGIATSAALTYLAGALLGMIILGGMCAYLASHKGYSNGYGFLTGFLLSVVGLIYYAGLPDRNAQGALLRMVELREREIRKSTPIDG